MAARGFTMVPNSVLRGEFNGPGGKRLSPSARILYAVLLDLSNCGDRPCTASQGTLGTRVGVSNRHIRNLLAELQKAHLIVRYRQGRRATDTILPQVLPEGKQSSAHRRNPASDKQEPQEPKNNNGSWENQSVSSSQGART